VKGSGAQGLDGAALEPQTHDGGSSAGSPAANGAPPSRIRRLTLRQQILRSRELGALIGFGAMLGFFMVASGGRGFLTTDGLISMATVASEIGVVAGFVTILMMAGEFDIGFGAVLAAGTTIIIVGVMSGYPFWLGLLAALAFAAVVAMIEGITVVRFGIPSLFVTLAVGSIIGGLLIIPYQVVIQPNLNVDLRPLLAADPLYILFGGLLPGGVRVTLLWWIGITVAVWYLLSRTSAGNWVLAVGGSVISARALGVPALRVKYAIFLGTALGGTILAALQATRVASADPGRGILLPFEAMISVFIGGSRPGSGSVVGTTIGVLTLTVLRQGMVFAGIGAYVYSLVLGAALLIAYGANELLRQRTLEIRADA
jgi:simple sugar transport system permease protein